ncbi:MAG TPA: sulfur carrier protein ThiS [Gemmatales bacterium]|nr:sulfur carrier protein ThiS [Gemmatales bacterium]
MPRILLNGEPYQAPEGTLADLLASLQKDPKRLAVEVNRELVPRSEHAQTLVREGDEVEMVTLVGGGSGESGDSPLQVAGFTFTSRLITGSGKYSSHEIMRECLEASGCNALTVAVRRERLFDKEGRSLLDFIDMDRYTILPNTAGCFNAADAIRHAKLGREILEGYNNPGARWVKLECLADTKTLLPDPIATLEATIELVKDGFQVMVYSSDDPILARRLKEAGAACVMPAGSPIGSGQGVLNANNIRILLEYLKENDPGYPVIIDAGVGTASDVAIAMELGCDGVLLNSAIAHAREPVQMAWAMRFACQAGRLAYLAGRMPRKRYATASSPTDGLF